MKAPPLQHCCTAGAFLLRWWICSPGLMSESKFSRPRKGQVMLVLTRRVGEEIVIDGNIRVSVVGMHGDRVRIGIAAPEDVRVDRQEIHERLCEFADDSRTGMGHSTLRTGKTRAL
jgi:carbon storage regulator